VSNKILTGSKIGNILKGIFAFLIGTIFVFILLEVFLRSFGWYQTNRNRFLNLSAKNNNEIRILSLGDSMTISGRTPYYPEQLQQILNTTLTDKKIAVFNNGVVSSTSNNILSNLEYSLDKYQPDIVTIMIGINDFGSVAYEDAAGIYKSDFLSNLKTYKLYKLLLKNIHNRLNKITVSAADNANTIESDFENLVRLGNESYSKGQNNTAKDYFEKALQINPNSDQVYVGLSRILKANGEINKEISYLKKAITINPNNAQAYILLGETWGDYLTIDEKIQYFKQAIKIDPNNIQSYISLSLMYNFKKMGEQELETINEGLLIDPNSYGLLMNLALYHLKKNNKTEAIKILNQAFEIESPRPYDTQLLAELYKSQGKTKEAEETLNLVTKSSGALAQNYQKIADILAKRGIILLAVQYPMRDITPLKIILRNTDAIFVDNDKSFKKAVAKNGFDKIFVDHFAGDLGHLTGEGHRIVAQNIADVLMKKVFKK
jgi:tetratricopeptide (TPR) repeat protein